MRQYKLQKELLPRRGEIFLQGKDGKFAVAVNKKMMTVYVVPMEVEDKEKVVKELVRILKVNEKDVRAKVNKKNDPYEVIKKRISEEEYAQLKEKSLPGVHFEAENWRYYPANELASSVIGFLGYDSKGVSGCYGIEQYFNDLLAGKTGYIEEESDAFGGWISIGKRNKESSVDGVNLLLTINQIIQFKAELALKNAIKKHQADGGRIVIMDVKTGSILAMATVEKFNPNEYFKFSASDFKNSIVNDSYEPGSVFKTITMAAGLDSGRIAPSTTYNDTGAVHVAGFTIKNSDGKAYGEQTMTEVIEKSLNTGVIFVEKLLGHKLFRRYVESFGFGQKTGIELPNESPGDLRNLKSKGDVEYFTASYGQGISVTPLQLVMAYGAIANNGVLLKPKIIDSYIKSEGGQEKVETKEVRRVISRLTAEQITDMLVSNVINGHGKLAGVPGYKIAGKTGTAQIPDKVNGGYLEGATIASFAGFAPADDPIFAMVVVIDHPRDIEWAAGTAAPVFGELSKFLLDYYRVKPTELFSEKDLEIFDKKHNYLDIVLNDEEGDENESGGE